MAKQSNASKNGRPKGGKRKPTHPYIKAHPDFPLSFHKGTGQFYKTHRGRRFYFGPEPVPAKRQFDREWSYIIRGEPIPEDDDGDAMRLGNLVDAWLADRLQDVEDKLLQRSTYADYERIGQFVADKLGRDSSVNSLSPDDFTTLFRAMRTKWGKSPTVFKRCITIAKMPFRWGFEMAKIDAMRFGPRFKAPTEDDIRAASHERGRQTYNPEEIRALIEAANPTLRAAILLGINGGYTQKEVAGLRRVWLDTDTGVLNHLRAKTKVPRRVPLWPETIEAIEAMPEQKAKREARGLLFVTREGKPQLQDHPVRIDNIGQMFTRLTDKLGINLDQAGFGKLRATHRTAADGVLDANACRVIMGHKLGRGVEGNYLKHYGITDDRLQAVVDHVHAWLYPPKKA